MSSLGIKKGRRKRKKHSELNFDYNSRPQGEAAVDKMRVDMLLEEFSKSKQQRFVAKFLFHIHEDSSPCTSIKVDIFQREHIHYNSRPTAEVRELVPRANWKSHVFESTFIDWTAWQKGVHGNLGLFPQQKTFSETSKKGSSVDHVHILSSFSGLIAVPR